MKRVAIGIAVVLAAYAVFRVARPSPLFVDTARALNRPMQVTVDEEGATRVRDRYVVAAPIAGRVARLTPREGDSVRAGAIVARVFPAPLDPTTASTSPA